MFKRHTQFIITYVMSSCFGQLMILFIELYLPIQQIRNIHEHNFNSYSFYLSLYNEFLEEKKASYLFIFHYILLVTPHKLNTYY